MKAKYRMLRPRRCREVFGGGPGWYYVEPEGIAVLNDQAEKVTYQYLTWKQIDQALALKRAAESETDGTQP